MTPRNRCRVGCHLAAMLALSALTACSSVEVSSDYAMEQDFSGYRRYGWHPDGIEPSASLDAMGGDIFDNRVRRIIDDTLRSRGMSPDQDADFYVSYDVITEDRVAVNTYPAYGGYGPGWGYYGYGPYPYYGYGGVYTSVYHYTQGTLVIDIVDASSNKLVWRATADGWVEAQKTPEKREQQLQKIIGRMLRDFPPAKTP